MKYLDPGRSDSRKEEIDSHAYQTPREFKATVKNGPCSRPPTPSVAGRGSLTIEVL